MFIDLQKLDEIKYAFTDLGVSVSDLSSKNEEYFAKTLNFVENFKVMMKGIIPEEGINEINASVSGVDKHVNEISKMVDSLSTQYDGVDDLSKSLEDATQKFSKISSDLASFTGGPKDEGLEKAKKDKAEKKKISKLGRYAQKEIGGVKAKAGQLLSTLRVPRLGGIAAGMIGIMAYGVMDKQRVESEFGQVADIMVNSVDRSVDNVMTKANRWASNFQEQIQKTYGIAKEEVQSVVKVFVEGGTAAKDWQAGHDRRLGQVGKNFASWSLGLDKLLNIGGGASAQRMVAYATKYNMELSESRNLLNEMMVVGQQDGVGRMQFIKNIESAGDAMEGMGYKLDGLVGVSEVLQKRLGELNLSEQFVGKYVGTGMKQVASSISNMGDEWQMFFGERLGMGQGIGAAQKFKDGLQRAAEGKGEAADIEAMFKGIGKIALESYKGDETMARYFLEKGPGIDTQGANLLVKLGQFDLKGTGKLTDKEKAEKSKLTKELQKNLKSSLQTEAQKRTKWELGMNKWMKGVAKLGQGLLGLATDVLTKMAAYVISAIPMLMNMFDGSAGAKRNTRLMDQLSKFEWASSKSMKTTKQGIEQLKDSAPALFEAIGGKGIVKNLEALSDLNPYSLATPSISGVGSRALATAGSGLSQRFREMQSSPINITAPPTVQVVPIPVRTPVMTDVPESRYKSEDPDVGGYYGEWLGGRDLQLVSYGVTSTGDIQLALVGECPRCALPFDGGFDEGEYKAALIAASGSVVKSPNTQAAGKVNFESEGAARDIRDIGLTSAVKRKLKEQKRKIPELDPRLTGVVKGLTEAFPGKDVNIFKSVGAGEKAHGKGKALDVGVEGVPSTEVYDYLASQGYGSKQGGLGKYPNQPFVHVDVMEGKPRKWIDASGKGEPANYVASTSKNKKGSGV